MKKNKMMRLASFLLIAVLLTTSVISGTFAKYVTTDSANDTARVAKWGVVASITGDMFGATHSTVDANGNTIITYSTNGGTVSSGVNAADFVVAPGTQNINAMVLSTSGTPEVSTKVTFDAAQDAAGKKYFNSEIYLEAGTYGVMVPYTGVKTENNCGKYYVLASGKYTTATAGDLDKPWYELHDEVTLAAKYLPLDWYVGDTKKYDTIDDLADEVKNTFNGNTFAPNKSVAASITIGWCWDFGDAWEDKTGTNNEIAEQDKWDTVLGNMMLREADKVVKKATDGSWDAVLYETVNADLTAATAANEIQVVKVGGDIVACLTVAFNGRITVEQVD